MVTVVETMPVCPRDLYFLEPTQKLPRRKNGTLVMRRAEQRKLSESLQFVIIEDGEVREEGDKPPDSQWVISIRQKIVQAGQRDAASSRPWDKLCIYRVPHCLREGDAKAYVPQIVSLGPYYHVQGCISEMDYHKWRALYHVLRRTGGDIKQYLDSVKELEEKARACYGGSITLSSDKFVEMMVLDGCFVIELLRGATEGFEQLGYSENDPIFVTHGSSKHSIQRDMIKLENQLPLFVLDRLLGLQEGNPYQKGGVAKLIPHFFDALMPTDSDESESSDQRGLHFLGVFRQIILRTRPKRPTDEPIAKRDRNKPESLLAYGPNFDDPSSGHGGFHCLDVFRRSLLRTRPESLGLFQRIFSRESTFALPKFVERRHQLIHCVTELREAGIKFKKRKTDCFWDIKFKHGILKIPRLFIDDGTKSLLLNLIAFEQCHHPCSNAITSYVVFMDNLINSPQDVAYLHYCGIIEHWLGSDAEVADLFNGLCQGVVFDRSRSYLSRLSKDVNRYYNYRWNTWRASLMHNYFSNPWAFISFVAAVVLLLLTSLQTFYGVYGYYKPM